MQLRLFLSCVGGVLCALLMAPYVLPVVEIRNVVVAGALGALLFLIVATIAGFVWRRAITGAPVRWALAGSLVIPAVIYAGLRLSNASEPPERELALDASLVAGFCAIFACAIFIAWSVAAPVKQHQSI